MEWCEDNDFQIRHSVKEEPPASQIHMIWELFSCQIHPLILGIRIKQTPVIAFRAGQINWLGMKAGALKFLNSQVVLMCTQG